jgi:hypothetical protein
MDLSPQYSDVYHLMQGGGGGAADRAPRLQGGWRGKASNKEFPSKSAHGIVELLLRICTREWIVELRNPGMEQF